MVPSKTRRAPASTVTLVVLPASTLSLNGRVGAGEIGPVAGTSVESAPPGRADKFGGGAGAGSAETGKGSPADGNGGCARGDGALAALICPARRDARQAKMRRTPYHPPVPSTSAATAARIQASQGRSDVTAGGLPVHTGTVGRSPAAAAYSATMFSSSSPRYRATARTNPRLKTPPGSRAHCSFSIAVRKRVAIRVAADISSSDTPRISRSRFR